MRWILCSLLFPPFVFQQAVLARQPGWQIRRAARALGSWVPSHKPTQPASRPAYQPPSHAANSRTTTEPYSKAARPVMALLWRRRPRAYGF